MANSWVKNESAGSVCLRGLKERQVSLCWETLQPLVSLDIQSLQPLVSPDIQVLTVKMCKGFFENLRELCRDKILQLIIKSTNFMTLLIQLSVLLPKLSVLRESSKWGVWRHGREGQMSQWLLLSVPLVTMNVQCWYCQWCIARTTCWLELLKLQLQVQTQLVGQMRGSAWTAWRIVSHLKGLVRKIQLS